MILAICNITGVVLEAPQNPSMYTAIEPQPYLSKISVNGSTRVNKNCDADSENYFTFREDSFDPTTRIRRGRIYKKFQKDICSKIYVNFGKFAWPFGYVEIPGGYIKNSGHVDDKSFSFYRNTEDDFTKKYSINSVIILGDINFSTAWRVVSIEKILTDEMLFTLKAIGALGTLPELIDKKLPEEKRTEIREGFEKVVDVAPIQIAESVIDVCREFARRLLPASLPTVGVADAAGKDLGDLIRKVPEQRVGVANAASIINRLHPRGKSAEQERQAKKGQEIRALSNEDASLAVSLIGFLLRDFGWAA